MGNTCPVCDAPIWSAMLVTDGSPCSVDAEPVVGGDVWVVRDHDDGTPVVAVASAAAPIPPDVRSYRMHVHT